MSKYPSLIRGLILILLSVFFIQCEDEDQKNVGEITSTMGLFSNAAMQGKLTIEDATIRISQIDFSGTPPSQDVLTKTRTFGPEEEPFSLVGNDEREIVFDAPMNTYEPVGMTINVVNDSYSLLFNEATDTTPRVLNFEDFIQNAKPALYLSARFDNRGQSTRVILAVDNLFAISIRAKQFDSFAVEIARENLAEILFNPAYWFEDISTQKLESAERVQYQGQDVILLHRQFNAGLYKTIVANIEETESAVFLKMTVTERD